MSGIGDTSGDTRNPEPDIPEDALVEARRRIADRCLYGVDKNPLAVEMAKLSLWLVTMQRGRPFTFLDHALKCGDSLLGVSVAQLRRWSLAGNGAAQQQTYLTEPIRRALLRSLRLRREIQVLPVNTVRDAEIKAEKLQRADEGMALVKLAADLLIAAELHPDAKQRVSLRGDFQVRMSVLAEAYSGMSGMSGMSGIVGFAAKPGASSGIAGIGDRVSSDPTPDRPDTRSEAMREAFAELRAEADRLLGPQRPFHWELEFPEVFIEEAGMSGMSGMSGIGDTSGDTLSPIPDTRGFAALVGNPPFQGGQRITGALGVPYRDYLVTHLAGGKRGSADLCAYFFLRGRDLLRQGGGVGLLATNTIAQGDTREVGLDQLAQDGFSIPRAVPSRKWPGTAAVEVAHIWLRRGEWQADYMLDETPVQGITPYLTPPGKAAGTPYRLVANAGKSFQGSIVLGMGFVLEPEEAQALIAQDPRNKDVLFPYLNGQDLNSSPDQSPSRWVINFFDWPLEQAEQYSDCMAIVREKVKPERDKLGTGNPTAKDRSRCWWQFARQTMSLYAAIVGMKRVLVLTIVTR